MRGFVPLGLLVVLCGTASAAVAPVVNYDLVCVLSGMAGDRQMTPVSFERVYSIDGLAMSRCDQDKEKCVTTEALPLQDSVMISGDAPPPLGHHYSQSDYDLSTGIMNESLAVDGKLVSQTSGPCQHRAFTPIGRNYELGPLR